MKFENSHFSKTTNYYKLEMSFGNFFLCEKFIISELNAGIHFDWPKIEEVVTDILNFYDKKDKLGYISNRINSYSVDPQIWAKVEKYNNNNFVVGGTIVYYNDMMYMNASLEKRFSKVNLHPCQSLDEAIEWILSLEALK
ncbi:hypothetical protein Q4Q39_09750 [Flavivirga amylovorans]|uniref:STAS/SEC14 domain-containing protein n=1 Tax=Flavivirga amylovorans TaxID=870486 RepID=A0ABT8X184_9FLAO|nr:hypothetical protein [Flavivirga amylovorans]MDO5987681.1 hypothetical protein [Flavivirga amylovorans]